MLTKALTRAGLIGAGRCLLPAKERRGATGVSDRGNLTMNSLPLFIFSTVRSGQDLAIQRGYGAAALLLFLVVVLFVITRFLARDKVRR